MKIIKIGIRHNLLYPIMSIIFSFFSDLDSIIIEEIFFFGNKLVFGLVVFLSEFIFGAFLYKYQKKSLSIEKSNTKNKANVSVIDKYKSNNNKLGLQLLLLANSFFVLSEFVISTFCFRQFVDLSRSLDIRLKSMLTFWSAFFCYFLLKMPVVKHQKCSLIIIFVCLSLIIILEGIVNTIYNKSGFSRFIKIIGLYFIKYMFSAILEVNQKYLLDYEFLNPFYILMIEGIYGFIFTFIFNIIVASPFKILQKKSQEHNNDDIKILISLIICFILYFVFSGGRNVYRLITNKIYSPMAKTFIDGFFVPLLIIFYYIIKNDFQIRQEGDLSFRFFICNLILSIIIVFCNCVYNELFILYCCDLEYDTFMEISGRATLKNEISPLLPAKKIEIQDGDNLYYIDYENKDE